MFSIFSDDDWFLSACLMLLTAAEDACDEEGGGSVEGGWRDSEVHVFSLCQRNAAKEGRRASITFKK